MKTQVPFTLSPGQQFLKDKVVLVVDDETHSRFVLTEYLQDFGCRVVTADSGPEGLLLARNQPPDLITVDLIMPQMSGWEFLKEVKADPKLREIPVVVVSVVANEVRGINLGAVELLNKPFTRKELLDTLKRHLEAEKGKVLLIDDDEDSRFLMSTYLAGENVEVRTASNGKEGLEILEEFNPDLVIFDLLMPVMDGMTVLTTIRKNPRHLDLPLVVVTGKAVSSEEAREFEGETSILLHKGEELEEDLKLVLREILKRKK